MKEKEYIEQLENALIFMCDMHQENTEISQKELDWYMSFSNIQGSRSRFAISDISKLTRKQFDLRSIKEEMYSNRNIK